MDGDGRRVPIREEEDASIGHEGDGGLGGGATEVAASREGGGTCRETSWG